MSNIIINDHSLSVKVYRGQRVVTFKDVDTVHNRPEGTAKRNFWQNSKRMIENTDYFIATPNQKDDSCTLEIPNRGITLLTESGYLMLVKSFTDDLAWEVQRQLVNNYFRPAPTTTVYPPKSTSAGEVASLLEAVDKPMTAQGSPGWKRASQAEKILRQFGVDIIEDFVEPPPPMQFTLEMVTTKITAALPGHTGQ